MDINRFNNVNGAQSVSNQAWFENKNKNEVSVDSFLQLMIAQLKNQDFNNPVDDTQYITQLAQFSTMQAMQELTQFSKTAYATSLVGKEVTAAKMSIGGHMETVTGVVTKVSLVDNEFGVFINDAMFSLNQIMEVKAVRTEEEAK